MIRSFYYRNGADSYTKLQIFVFAFNTNKVGDQSVDIIIFVDPHNENK